MGVQNEKTNENIKGDSKEIIFDKAVSHAGQSGQRVLADDLAEKTGLSRLVLVQSDEKVGDSLLAIKRSLIPLSISTRWWLRDHQNVTVQPKLAMLVVNVSGGPATKVVGRLKQHAGQRLKYCLVLAALFFVLVCNPVLASADERTLARRDSANLKPKIHDTPATFKDILAASTKRQEDEMWFPKDKREIIANFKHSKARRPMFHTVPPANAQANRIESTVQPNIAPAIQIAISALSGIAAYGLKTVCSAFAMSTPSKVGCAVGVFTLSVLSLFGGAYSINNLFEGAGTRYVSNTIMGVLSTYTSHPVFKRADGSVVEAFFANATIQLALASTYLHAQKSFRRHVPHHKDGYALTAWDAAMAEYQPVHYAVTDQHDGLIWAERDNESLRLHHYLFAKDTHAKRSLCFDSDSEKGDGPEENVCESGTSEDDTMYQGYTFNGTNYEGEETHLIYGNFSNAEAVGQAEADLSYLAGNTAICETFSYQEKVYYTGIKEIESSGKPYKNLNGC